VSSDRDRLRERLRELRDLSAAAALLAWDQEVMLPPRGVPSRARQTAALAGVIHEKLCAQELGELIEGCASASSGEPSAIDAAILREARRERDRAVKIPRALVTELAAAVSLAQQVWADARERDDWAAFAPHLAKLVGLKRQEAAAVGGGGEAYDALLDEYEPDTRAAQLEPLFTRLRGELTELLGAIVEAGAARGGAARGGAARTAVFPADFPIPAQEALSREVLAAIGFDMEAGRLDVSAHPFTSATSPGDVRLTTRYDPSDLRVGLYATIHEAGHGLYEQGIPPELAGTPAGDCASLGIHESQSRLWENMIGRSRAFWTRWGPRARALFPAALASVADEELYRAVNVVRPSLIRIEADEVTYNLHIVLRFELERALLAGAIEAADLPRLWNERMHGTLGVTPARAREGVLQDIHWACGLFGYFPTYTLGNLYAAQFHARAAAELGDLPGLVAGGDTAPLLGWLRRNIHARGRLLGAAELCREVTGRDLDAAPFVDYLWAKFGDLYGLRRR